MTKSRYANYVLQGNCISDAANVVNERILLSNQIFNFCCLNIFLRNICCPRRQDRTKPYTQYKIESAVFTDSKNTMDSQKMITQRAYN